MAYTPKRGILRGQVFQTQTDYRNALAQAQGFATDYEKRASRNQRARETYEEWATFDEEWEDLPPDDRYRYARLFTELQRDRQRHPNRKDQNLSASGPLAQLLVESGLRDPDWDWDVGQTPKSVSTAA